MGTDHRLTREDVAHVASLARLHLSDDELDLFTGQLASVLDHAADVASLDLAGVSPTAHPLPVANVFRPDEPRPSLDRDELLAEAPSVEDNRFRVPRILGEAP
ncbi:MAG TPA: Asp-tRNA(Asn)/Glu-tRNA(Gln) amidotransferase subunit GatC [Acidimicrobiales bacterium]|jgi:aspartyl-tRNA(Asn)/glutamyl-tRNA(Gln) amidotransferase subunit C|nr:Asp-tRNA(Asn)/Glu-tRNA(Gln) amidotransferase subunit GatC [Acidimicrobiales bacterium]